VPFIAFNTKQARCKPGCGVVRKPRADTRGYRGRQLETEFIGVDGEGITLNDGSHHYVLLSVGESSLHDNGDPLTHSSIFKFLWECYLQRPNATYAGFFLGYDFTQWLKSLPENRAYSLLNDKGIALRARKMSGGNFTPFPVDVNQTWYFDMLAAKRFKLSGDRGVEKRRWLYINDAGSYFQTSFLNAIDPKKWEEPIATEEEYAIILEGKAIRSTAKFSLEMIKYNVTENVVFSRLMKRLDKGYQDAGIKLKRQQWFGPGQGANKWLASINAPTSELAAQVMPTAVTDAARAAYYGGWFEIFMHGLVPGTTYGYDINSAYPYGISLLPCFEHGEWIHNDAIGALTSSDSFGTNVILVNATVETTSTTLGTMLHRDSRGRILRPRTTTGWFYLSELIATRLPFMVHESWRFMQECDHLPFSSITELYNRRLEVGKNSPAGIAYKLLYNSAYGKTAQSIGVPKYANPFYASLITSTCRKMILDAIHSHPTWEKDLVMVATDGVYFRTPHPTLPISETQLGLWGREYKDDLTVFMPGVYWDNKTREGLLRNEDPKLRSRGINARDLGRKISRIDSMFDSFNGVDWPSLEIPVAFTMITAKQALAMNRWEDAGRVSSSTRLISSYPGNKRVPIGYQQDGVWRTENYGISENGVSCPYKKPIGIDYEPITRDGSINDDVQELLKAGI